MNFIHWFDPKNKRHVEIVEYAIENGGFHKADLPADLIINEDSLSEAISMMASEYMKLILEDKSKTTSSQYHIDNHNTMFSGYPYD